MKKLLLMCAVALFAFSACTKPKEDDGSKTPSVVGEWSGTRDSADREGVRLHLSLKEDGSFAMIKEAWAQQRLGKYTVKDNVINVHIEKIEWLWDRGNGYEDAYDELGYKYDENHVAYPDPMAVFRKDKPEEADFNLTFSFDKDGILTFNEDIFGMNLFFFSNPDYKPTKHLW